MNIIPNVVTTPGYALPAGFKTAVQAACNFYDQLFSNPVNLNITFTYAPVSGGSAQNVAAGGYLDFANVQADLLAVANSTTGTVDQKAAVETLGPDPTNGGSFFVTTAQAEAWGLPTSALQGLSSFGQAAGADGTVTLSNAYSWDFNANNRAVPGQLDAIGAFEHEISEVMGRNGILGSVPLIYNQYGSGTYTELDLFRYNSVNGLVERSLIPGSGFFSIDGKNLLTQYNNPNTGGDATDWANINAGGPTGDSFGQPSFAVPSLVSQTDVREMNILGWNVANQTVAQAQALVAADPVPNLSLSIVDSSANVSQNIDALQALAKQGDIGSITFTDSSPLLAVYDSQITSDALALSLINPAQNYNLSVTMFGAPLTYTLPNNVSDIKLTGWGGGVLIGNRQSDVFDVEALGNFTIKPDQLAGCTIKGNAGTTLDYSTETHGIHVNLPQGTVTKYYGTDTFSSVQGFKGGSGDDVFVSNNGAFTFDGGTGSNTLDYSWDPSSINVDLQAGTVSKGVGINGWGGSLDRGVDQVSHIQHFIGGAGNDTFVSNIDNNYMFTGGSGANTFDYSWNAAGMYLDLQNRFVLKNNSLGSASPKDTFSNISSFKGGSGDDVFYTVAGNYSLDGGGAYNSADYSWDPLGVQIDLQAGTVWKGQHVFKGLRLDDGTDTVSHIQDFTGGAGNNTFVSSLADDYTFYGGNGGTNTLNYSWDTQAVTIDLRTGGDGNLYGTVTKGYVHSGQHYSPLIDKIANFHVFDGGSGGTTFIASVEPSPPPPPPGGGGSTNFNTPIAIPTAVSYTFNGASSGLNTLDYSRSDAAIGVTINLQTDTVQKFWMKGATPILLGTDTFSNIEDFIGGRWPDHNTLFAGPGTHAFNGEAPLTSTAVFHGAHTEYSLQSYKGADGLEHTTIIDNGSAGDGTLDVVNVGTLQFTDHTYSLVGGNLVAAALAGAAPATTAPASGAMGHSTLAAQTMLLSQYMAAALNAGGGAGGAIVTDPSMGDHMAGGFQIATGGFEARRQNTGHF